MYGYGYSYGYGLIGGNTYNPLINYAWSSTYQANNQMYSTNSGTGTDLQLYSGQGVKFNGVDQSLAINLELGDVGNISYTISTNNITSNYDRIYTNSSQANFYTYKHDNVLFIKKGSTTKNISAECGFYFKVGKVYNITETWDNGYSQVFIDGICVYSFNYTGTVEVTELEVMHDSTNLTFFDGTLKDLYVFNDTLTQTEITKYSTNPNGFFNDALVDDTCVLNMPLAEHSTDCYDYANDTWHTIANYTDSCRDEAKQLPYGSQNANYKINGLGMRTDESPYFEADGVGKAIIPSHTDNVNINLVVNPTELNGNILSGGLTLDTTGLTVGVDNTINLTNQTPTADITLADGFKGIIKSYKEELV